MAEQVGDHWKVWWYLDLANTAARQASCNSELSYRRHVVVERRASHAPDPHPIELEGGVRKAMSRHSSDKSCSQTHSRGYGKVKAAKEGLE